MQVFAHRGASAEAPENSLLAIRKALMLNVDGIEIDIQQVGNQLVVFHDRQVDRNTSGKGLLHDFSWQQLQTLSIGENQFIPSLWQVLETVNGRCKVNIELKSLLDISLLVACINHACQDLNFCQKDFIVSSFDHHLLLKFKHACPEINIGALTASKPIKYAEFASELGAYSVNIDMSVATKAFIADAKKRSLRVMIYTVDNPKELLQLQAWGVDGVFCNDPRTALQILKSGENRRF
jgi:glycerophosphoryl diester phosphodiesterase